MLADRVISCAQSLECHRAWHHGAYLAIIKAGLPRATRCSIERVEVETKNTRNEITTSVTVRWKTLLCMPAGMPRSTGVICATRGQTYTQNTDFTSPPFILTSGSHFRNDAIAPARTGRPRTCCNNDSASGSVLTRKNEHRRIEGTR